MSEETEETEVAQDSTATCVMCDHAKHDGKTCEMEGCDCATE